MREELCNTRVHVCQWCLQIKRTPNKQIPQLWFAMQYRELRRLTLDNVYEGRTQHTQSQPAVTS